MSGNVRRLIYRCAVAAIAVLAGVALRPPPVRTGGDTAGSIWRPVNVEWPAGLTSVSGDATLDLVAAITADIDSDGDLDVVATDQSLNLLVWVNDGTGHLTRQRPRHSGGDSTSSGAPTFERRAPSVAFSTLNDPPSAGIGPRPDVDALLPGAKRPATADPFLPSSTAPYRPSRAPPSRIFQT
jgi:hypothetical protein